MAYCTTQDVIDRLGETQAIQVTSDSGDTVNTAIVDEARLGAEGEANGYLAKRYQVPVDLSLHPDLAAVLKSAVLDVAVYRLMTRRPPAAENYKTARDQAIEWLKMISEGTIVLPSVPPAEPTTSNGTLAAYGSNEAVLSGVRDL